MCRSGDAQDITCVSEWYHALASPYGRGGRAQLGRRGSTLRIPWTFSFKKRPKALSVSAAPSQLSHRESQGGGSVLSARVVFETWRAAGSCHAPSGPCLSLWERWPSAARTERVNAHDTNERYHSINAPRPSQSRLRRASSPRGRAKGLRAVLQ